MPKSKDATARIQMFHKIRIPFVFTLEASFAGASKGKIAGKHFSCRDLMNVGKYVLKAFWECKKLFLNKGLLKQISAEAQSQVTQKEGDGDSDEGCSSSEEAEPPTASQGAKKKAEQGKSDVIEEEATISTQVNGDNSKSQNNLANPPKTSTTLNGNENMPTDPNLADPKLNSNGQIGSSRNGTRALAGMNAQLNGQMIPGNPQHPGQRLMHPINNFNGRTQGMLSLKRLGTISRDFGDPKLNKCDQLGQSVLNANKNQISTDFVKRAVPQTQQKLSILGTTTDLDQFNYINGFKMDPQALA